MRTSLGVVAGLVAVGLAGCSSGNGGTTSVGTTTAAAASTTSGASGTSGTSGSGAGTGATSGSTSGSTGGPSCATIGEGNRCTTPAGIGGECCGGACVDPAHDPLNCGICGRACPTGSTCDVGACAVDGGTVTGCGVSCPAGTACATGEGGSACILTACAASDVGANCDLDGGVGSCCGTSCVDLNTDPQNCEFCGSVCGAGQTCSFPNGCSGGCPEGSLPFGGACLPTTCTAAAQGQLACAYDGGSFADLGTCCEEQCVDTISDPNNCQTCGNVCPTGSFCNSGFCPLLSCADAPANTQCMLSGGSVGSCCNGACVDLASDSADCGGCGFACPASGSCSQGVCDYSDGGFFECSTDPSACPSGTQCVGILCITVTCDLAHDGESCAFGAGHSGECCGGSCKDIANDPQNCGACGFGSPGGICVGEQAYPPPVDAGLCFGCPAGDICYGPYCIDPGCGLEGVCLTADGGPAACCPRGAGAVAVCTDVEGDPANCGGCGFACPTGQTCTQGVCSGTAQACTGLVEGYCDLDAGPSFLCCPGGGCTDTRSDANNCGTCGTVCTGACAAGVCG